MGFKYGQRYDLRMKDIVMTERIPFSGSDLCDTKETVQMKKNLNRNTGIIVGLCAVIAFAAWMFR